MVGTLPLQFGIPGGPELLIILLIAVLLFGANKIPKLARSTGEAMGEFQKGREEVEQELQDIREGESEESESETPSTMDDAGPSPEDTEVDEETAEDQAESETRS
jgi:sec-independent protein translocase protein TatA